MYRVSPLTYFLEGLAIAGVAGTTIQCSSSEMLQIPLPSGMEDCTTYLAAYLKGAGGYLSDSDPNPNTCSLCPISQVDTVLQMLGIGTSKVTSWRNVGILIGYVVFDVALVFGLYYLLRHPRSRQ